MPEAEYQLYPLLQTYAQQQYGPSANHKDAVLGFVNWVDDDRARARQDHPHVARRDGRRQRGHGESGHHHGVVERHESAVGPTPLRRVRRCSSTAGTRSTNAS